MDIVTVAEMRQAEREADAAGLSYAQMMQTAGRGAARVVAQRMQSLPPRNGPPRRVLVLAGPGNNGGDGLVCAAALAAAPHGATAHMRHCADQLMPLMAELRAAVDGLETLVDDAAWPLPTYQEMLFVR